ncbi:putative polypeptide N-acetylgalactosaminyltransferase-like protein 3 [Turdus rufiventris]|nr:putative polypeptide N-acetylgalactosaminyltransferase-like protein 3 [Turdus rufiventris]
MASLRRVKVLLVLNLIAVAGFVLFLAKCRPITSKSGDSFHDIHPRAEVANLTAHGISSIQDAVLKRLSLLEDIVYRQLNGYRITQWFGLEGTLKTTQFQPSVMGRDTSHCPRVVQAPSNFMYKIREN